MGLVAALPNRGHARPAHAPASWSTICRTRSAVPPLAVRVAVHSSWRSTAGASHRCPWPVACCTPGSWQGRCSSPSCARGSAQCGWRPAAPTGRSALTGRRRWTQVANLGATGSRFGPGAAGPVRTPDTTTATRLGSTLIGAAGVGLLGSAVFATDPVSGYPPAVPDGPPRS